VKRLSTHQRGVLDSSSRRAVSPLRAPSAPY
jgi:hypothetical protein